MRNILRVLRGDLRRMTASVVAIVTLMGLCIIPCLYAWFNIFSNWAPYDTDATGRIRVAVANSDAGAEVLGLRVNVGDKIIEALQSNDSIGWVFPDTADEALEGVWASEYYAALIIPEDFTQNTLSFLGGSLENPKLLYYENEKKNAIAPKITGKAKTAVQEQVNATFVETIATYVSDAASVLTASGYDPQTVLRSVSAQTEQLNNRLEDVNQVLRAASGLTGAAESLIGISGTLVSNANAVAQAGQSVLNAAGETVSGADTASGQTAAALRSLITQFNVDLEDLSDTLTIAFGDLNRYNDFVTNDLSARAALAAAYRDNAQTAANDLDTLGLTALSKGFSDLAARYGRIYDRLSRLETVSEGGWDSVRSEQQVILSEIAEAQTVVTTLGSAGTEALESKLQTALTAAQTAVNEASASLSGMGGSFQQLGAVLVSYNAALNALQDGLVGTAQTVSGLQDRLNTVSALLERLSESELLGRLTGILSDD
ncbi:MAG: YhgE/Pip family protein, partial [Oscillospiraceae bacterium]|nr:YhgE/Pip family protein [Oscillospiraceae bacterium]